MLTSWLNKKRVKKSIYKKAIIALKVDEYSCRSIDLIEKLLVDFL